MSEVINITLIQYLITAIVFPGCMLFVGYIIGGLKDGREDKRDN